MLLFMYIIRKNQYHTGIPNGKLFILLNVGISKTKTAKYKTNLAYYYSSFNDFKKTTLYPKTQNKILYFLSFNINTNLKLNCFLNVYKLIDITLFF